MQGNYQRQGGGKLLTTNKKSQVLVKRNVHSARARWGDDCTPPLLQALRGWTERLGLSVERGDVLLLSGNWYVTHSGLLSLARRKHCFGIHARPVSEFCDAVASRWAFESTVYTSPTSKGFVGYGDADPSNVSSLVRGAEMRVAETRAVNRALRKAYGIGICSVEEIGSFSTPPQAPAERKRMGNGSEPANGNVHRPLRDRLCLLIRKHSLDANLVKLYAADFCGIASLREAGREQVQEFINHLAQYAEHDREGLLCQLNSYAPPAVCPVAETAEAPVDEKAAGAA